jgi:hypothetical protein
MKLKVGMTVKIKNHKVRPSEWNYGGKMDHYFGKTVVIDHISMVYGLISIKTPPGERDWTFKNSDFEPYQPLPDELFEI